MADENNESGFVDRMADKPEPLHEESSADSAAAPGTAADGKGDGGGTLSSTVATPNPELAALKEQIEKVEKRAFEAEQRATYFQGQVAAREPQKPTEPEVPKPFVFDKKTWQERLENDGPQAIYDLANEIADDKIRRNRAEIETNVDGKLTQRQREDNLKTAF